MEILANQSLVSVIVPCYNHAHYLPDALASVQAQTYSNWECIIVNDASTDNTIEVATIWVQKDARFKLLNAVQNSGLAAARNLGILHSKGEFILPLDADDKLDDNFVLNCMSVFSFNLNLKLVYTNAKCFGDSNEIVNRPRFSLEELCKNNLIHCTALYRRKDYNQTKGYRPNMKFGYEDWDFWMQLIDKNDQVYQINEPIFFIRVKSDSMYKALTSDNEKEQKMREQIRQNNPSFYRKFSGRETRSFKKIIKSAIKKVTW